MSLVIQKDSIAKPIDCKAFSLDSMFNIAGNLIEQAPDSCLLYVRCIEAKSIIDNDITSLLKAYAIGGQSYEKLNITDSALLVYSIGYQQALKDENIEQQAKFMQLEARVLTKQGKYAEALVRFEEAIKMVRDNHYDFLPQILLNNAQLHYFLMDYKTSITSLNEALDLYKKKDDKIGEATTYNNLGIIYKRLGVYDSAMYAHNASLKISAAKNDSIGMAYSYNNIGGLKMDEQNYEEALLYFEKALQSNPVSPTLVLINNMSNTLKELGRKKEALVLLEDVFLTYVNQGNNSSMREISNSLYALHKELGNYKESLFYLEHFNLQNKAIINAEKVKEIERLKAFYDSNKKESEIATLTEKTAFQELINKQKSVLVFVLSGALIMALLLGGFFINYKVVQARVDNVVLEQKLLRSQMNPHFIFNTLGAIQTFIIENKNKQAVSYLVKFSKLVRIILENSRESFVEFDTELIALKHYISLQKFRFSDKFDYSIEMNAELEENLQIKVPPMILQPFVENAIQHGFSKVKEKGQLAISFELIDKLLFCTISDNGIGRDAASKIKSTSKFSLSTTIIEERLRILSKKKNNIRIIDLKENNIPSGTMVTIEIPIK